MGSRNIQRRRYWSKAGPWLVAHLAFADVQGPYTFSVEDGVAVVQAFDRGHAGHLDITNQLGGAPVTALAPGAFMGCTNLTSVHIPETVTKIHDSAFAFCHNLKRITVHPDNPAFSSVDGTLLDKSQSVFLLCPAGRDDHYSIPHGVHTIAVGAFHSCLELAGVEIPPTVTTIQELAFHWCTNLTSITIPGSVAVIEPLVFYRCSGLTNLVISDGVTTIGTLAFAHCYQLPNVSLPASVIHLGERPFSACLSLTNISVAPENPNFSSRDGVLYDKTQTVCLQYPPGRRGSYTLPPTVQAIAAGAFEQCSGLTDLVIPQSVAHLGAGAFYGCINLQNVMLPQSLVEVGPGAFAECLGLRRVYVLGDAPTIGTGAFRSSPAIVYYRPETSGWTNRIADRPAVSWEVRFEQLEVSEGRIALRVAGTPDIPIALEVSTNLIEWTRIGSTNLSGGTWWFLDSDATNPASRFYRFTGW